MENKILDKINKSIKEKNKYDTFYYFQIIKNKKLKILNNNFLNKLYFLDDIQLQLIKKDINKLLIKNNYKYDKRKIILSIIFIILIFILKKKIKNIF